MSMTFGDPFDVLLELQRAMETRRASDWLRDATTSSGPYPPINVFKQDEDFVAIIELAGVEKDDLQIQTLDNTIRIAGKKAVSYGDNVSMHRRERIAGEFDRTLTLPVHIDPEGVRAEYRDGLLALFIATAESAKARKIRIT